MDRSLDMNLMVHGSPSAPASHLQIRFAPRYDEERGSLYHHQFCKPPSHPTKIRRTHHVSPHRQGFPIFDV